MPIRPQSTPTWLQILNHSAQVTAQNAQLIQDNMDKIRENNFKTEQAKMSAMESAYKLQQEDRYLRLREAEFRHRLDTDSRSANLDEITTALDIEKKELQSKADRVKILNDTYLEPLKAKYEDLRFDPNRKDEAAKLKAQIEEVEGKITPIMGEIANLPLESDPIERANKIREGLNQAGTVSRSVFGPQEQDILFNGPTKNSEPIIVPGAGPQQIDPSLFPGYGDEGGNVSGSQSMSKKDVGDRVYSDNASPADYQFFLNEVYPAGNIPANEVSGAAAYDFDFGQGSTYTAPTTNKQANKVATTDAVQSKPEITDDYISQIHREAEANLNAASAAGKLTDQVKANTYAYIDRMVGPENNRYRAQSVQRLKNLAQLDPQDVGGTDEIANAIKREGLVLGYQSAWDVYLNEKHKVSDSAREQDRIDKLNKENAEKLKDNDPVKRQAAILDQISKVKSILKPAEEGVELPLSPEMQANLRDNVLPQLNDALAQATLEASGIDVKQSSQFGQFGFDDLNPIVGEAVANLGTGIDSQFFNSNNKTGRIEVNENLAKEAEKISVDSFPDVSEYPEYDEFLAQSFGNRMKDLGIEVDFKGSKTRNLFLLEPFDKSSKNVQLNIESKLRDKYSKEYDNLSPERKEKFAKGKPKRRQETGYEMMPTETNKEAYIRIKLEQKRPLIAQFVAETESAYNAKKREKTKAEFDSIIAED